MDPQDTRFNQLVARLKEKEYRLTPQRLALVRLITTNREHLNAYQIYDRIREQFPTMSQATVYKTLNLLTELGEVLEIPLKEDSHFDGYRPEPHTHFICTRCHQIMDCAIVVPATQIEQAEAASGFRVDHYQLNLYGICPDCLAKEE